MAVAAAEAAFAFDEKAHVYTLGGQRLPGVTEILKGLGIIDYRWAQERDLIRGQAVHLACKYLAENCLDWTSVDPSIRGYVEAYQKFLKDTSFLPQVCEKPMFNLIYRFSCTPDQIGVLNGRDTICEIKTGSTPPWVGLQTAAQALAYKPDGWMKVDRVCLELRADGSNRLTECLDLSDGGVFLSAVSVFTWKLIKGIE